MRWSAIAVTAESTEAALAHRALLQERQKQGCLPGADAHTIFVAAPDPQLVDGPRYAPGGRAKGLMTVPPGDPPPHSS